MLTCDHCRNLLWDELYGLLEASESDSLRQHVAGCAACQAELARAEAGQRLIAKVAMLHVNVPLFTMPAPERVPATLPLDQQPLPATRRFRLRPWHAAAAAVFLCLGVSYLIYRQGLSERTLALREAESKVDTILAQRQDLQNRAEVDLKSLQAANRAKHVHLQVLGPAAYQQGVASEYRVVATNLNGEPAPVKLTARLTGDDKKTLFEKSFEGKGEFTVTVPKDLPARPRTEAVMEFVAVNLSEPTQFQEKVAVVESNFATHLTTDKVVYHPGEKIYFRSLTLKPFDLTPAGRTFKVAFTLMNPRSLKTPLRGQTRLDGIGSGMFELPGNALPGKYMLTVTDTENHFTPVTCDLVVRGKDDSEGVKAGAAPPGSVNVQFFPEGGRLIAGLVNRVYFSAYTPEGLPVDLEGRVVDTQDGKETVVRTPAQAPDSLSRGLGVFTFIPARGQAAKLHVTSPAGVPDIAMPLGQSDGIRLSILDAVAQEGDTLPILLQSTGNDERRLVVAISCRGSLVGEQIVTAGPGTTQAFVKLGQGARGVLRVTAFEADAGVMRPVAERLIYRIPRERLGLAIEPDKKQYRPGDHVTLTLRSGTEKGQPDHAWLLVSTAKWNTSSQANGLPNGRLPPHIDFSSQLDLPEEIEQGYFAVHDDRDAQAALDLFLGTKGWRRLAEPPRQDALAGGKNRGPSRDEAAVAMFARDNLGEVANRYLAQMEEESKKTDTALTASLQALDLAAPGQRAEVALRELTEYQEKLHSCARMALGSGTLLTLLAGGFFLTFSIVGMARRSVKYRRQLGWAFAALLLCLVTLPLSKRLASGGADLILGPSNPISSNQDGANVGKKILKDLQIEIAAKTDNQPGRLFLPIGVNFPSNSPGSPRKQQFPPLPIQQFVFNLSAQPADVKAPETLLWQPLLSLNAQAQVSFDLPKEPGIYRIHVEGHSNSGRLGLAEHIIDTRSESK